MSKRTPGPWRVGSIEYAQVFDVMAPTTAVCRMYVERAINSGDTPNPKANAAFIAAACNAYDGHVARIAALEAALRLALLHTPSEPCDALPAPNEACGCWRCGARAAL